MINPTQGTFDPSLDIWNIFFPSLDLFCLSRRWKWTGWGASLGSTPLRTNPPHLSAGSEAKKRDAWKNCPMKSSRENWGPCWSSSLAVMCPIPCQLFGEFTRYNPQTTGINRGLAHCLALRAPSLDLWLEISRNKVGSLGFKDWSGLHNSNLKLLIHYQPQWHDKANRWELVLTHVFHTIQ